MIIDYHPITTDQATSDEITAYKTSITRNQFDKNLVINGTVLYLIKFCKISVVIYL